MCSTHIWASLLQWHPLAALVCYPSSSHALIALIGLGICPTKANIITVGGRVLLFGLGWEAGGVYIMLIV